MDKGTIIARALSLLGNRNYAVQAGTQDPAEQHFADVLTEANSVHDWSFARAKVLLTPNKDGGCVLPVDCIASGIRYVSDDEDRRKLPYGFELIGNTIYPNNYRNAVTVRYTRSLMDAGGETPNFPMFNNYVVALLASRIAPQVIGGAEGLQLSDKYLQQSEMYRDKAIAQDRMQDRSNDQRPNVIKLLWDRKLY